MLVCGRKTDGVAFRVKPRDYPTIQFFIRVVSGQVNELGLDPSICGSVTHSPDQFRIPLSSVVERLA